jgi:TRL-like protein family
MKFATLAVLGIVAAGSFGCAAITGGYPSGSLYTGTQTPHGMMRLEGAGAGKGGTKTGESCATGILSIVAFGDATLASAKKAGGVTDVHSVEFGSMSILGIYTQGCTIVYGN